MSIPSQSNNVSTAIVNKESTNCESKVADFGLLDEENDEQNE
jgi:hypothetical protein